MRLSLAHALIVFVIAPLLLIVGTLGWFGLNRLEQQAEQRMRKDIEIIGRALQPPLRHALLRNHPGAIQEALDAAFNFSNVYGAHVFDENGDLIAGAGAGGRALSVDQITDLTRTGRRMGSYTRVEGKPLYVYFVPLTDAGGRIAALLQISRPGSDFSTVVHRIRILGGAALGLLALTLAAIVLAGHRWAIGKPVRDLAAGMARVGAGDRDYRAPASGPGEIRILAEGFNNMLDRIQRSEREIRRRQEVQAGLEADLRHSRKLAAVGALAAGVAHELGTPLTVIDGKARKALRQTSFDDPPHAALIAVRREVGRMSTIVRQLLDFAHRSTLERRPIQASRLLRGAMTRVEELRARTATDLDLAPGDGAVSLPVDRARLEQALVNLLRNAIQASPGGCVRTGWLVRDGCTELFVEDDGPGVPGPDRQRVFEPFFTSKPVGSGTGLGLSVVHGVVTDHGGEVSIEDSKLGGARFTIRITDASP